MAEGPRQPVRLCCIGSVALRESWLMHMASWLLSWNSRGVVLSVATVQKQGEPMQSQTLALQCCNSLNSRSGNSRDPLPQSSGICLKAGLGSGIL